MPAWKKLLVALTLPLAFFATLELALRLARFEFRQEVAPILIWNPREDAEMEKGQALHELAAAQLWRPRAGAPIEWGEGEEVNAAGFRGPLVKPAKPPGVLRVVTLGDSSTFGWGVPYPDSYSAQLEARLREAGERAQVLDCGVIGFTVRQGLERYRELGRRFQPDVVVAAFGAVNEHHGRLGLVDRDKIARRKGTTGALARLVPELRLAQLASYARFVAIGGEKGARQANAAAVKREHELMQTAGELDWPGVRRVPLEDFERALRELAREVEADGARLVVIAMPRMPIAEEKRPVLLEYTRRLRELAAGEGWPLLDANAMFRAEFERRPPDELFAGDWWHPNAEGHALIAEGLAPLVLEAARPSD